jgi:hypothetical protein
MSPRELLADKGYDSDALRASWLSTQPSKTPSPA